MLLYRKQVLIITGSSLRLLQNVFVNNLSWLYFCFGWSVVAHIDAGGPISVCLIYCDGKLQRVRSPSLRLTEMWTLHPGYNEWVVLICI